MDIGFKEIFAIAVALATAFFIRKGMRNTPPIPTNELQGMRNRKKHGKI